jgi:hypothetical protein
MSDQSQTIPARVGNLTNVPIAVGQSTTISGYGQMVYIVIATAPVNVRTRGSKGTSSYSLLTQGTGINDTEFDVVDLQNPNAVPIVVQVWTGLSKFIDNRLILANQQIPQVAFPTAPTANSLTHIAINDLSGGAFTDINGVNWLALQRLAIIVCNVDSGATFLLQAAGAATATGPAVAAVYPLTSLNLPVSGDYSMDVGGGTINVIVSEIYLAILA